LSRGKYVDAAGLQCLRNEALQLPATTACATEPKVLREFIRRRAKCTPGRGGWSWESRSFRRGEDRIERELDCCARFDRLARTVRKRRRGDGKCVLFGGANSNTRLAAAASDQDVASSPGGRDGRGGMRRTTTAKDTGRGVPQGAPISPLLANLYMRRFVLTIPCAPEGKLCPRLGLDLCHINAHQPCFTSIQFMTPFLYHCPNTGLRVQGCTDLEESKWAENIYESVSCLACGVVHLVNPKTGRSVGLA
jgi:hypothetical protein